MFRIELNSRGCVPDVHKGRHLAGQGGAHAGVLAALAGENESAALRFPFAIEYIGAGFGSRDILQSGKGLELQRKVILVFGHHGQPAWISGTTGVDLLPRQPAQITWLCGGRGEFPGLALHSGAGGTGNQHQLMFLSPEPGWRPVRVFLDGDVVVGATKTKGAHRTPPGMICRPYPGPGPGVQPERRIIDAKIGVWFINLDGRGQSAMAEGHGQFKHAGCAGGCLGMTDL